ncbi:putative glycine--tRNA ligase [Helianthus anomalus]
MGMQLFLLHLLAGNISHGLRNAASATTLIDSSESCANVMQQAGISVDTEQRKKIIVERANYLAKGVDECLVMQSNLLDEVTSYSCKPCRSTCSRARKILRVIPSAPERSVMQKHHKHFALTDTNRSLLPYFITVRYIISSKPQLLNLKLYFLTLLISSQVANGAINESIVRKGNEAILRARYEDAKFFYELDTS